MTKTPKGSPKTSPRQPSASEVERLERQVAALRENLRRRKKQSRGRETPKSDC